MATVLMGMDRVPDQEGYLVISQDGAVLASGGDLENDERTASIVSRLVINSHKLEGEKPMSGWRRISIMWKSFSYMITISNHKIFVVKRAIQDGDPIA